MLAAVDQATGNNTMIPQTKHRNRTDPKRSRGARAPERTVPGPFSRAFKHPLLMHYHRLIALVVLVNGGLHLGAAGTAWLCAFTVVAAIARAGPRPWISRPSCCHEPGGGADRRGARRVRRPAHRWRRSRSCTPCRLRRDRQRHRTGARADSEPAGAGPAGLVHSQPARHLRRRARPDAVIWDTTERGQPYLLRVAHDVCRDFADEAVQVSQQQGRHPEPGTRPGAAWRARVRPDLGLVTCGAVCRVGA